jgi:hypothetical protein
LIAVVLFKKIFLVKGEKQVEGEGGPKPEIRAIPGCWVLKTRPAFTLMQVA